MKLHCLECSALVFSLEFWSWKFGSPGPKFSAEKWSPWTHLFSKSGHTPWNLVWVMQSGKPVVVHWIRVRKSISCLLLLHFHTSLFASGAFLWLVGSFSLGTALGTSMIAPIKACHLFVSRKTSYLRWFFFFLVTYLGSLMLLTTFSTEPYSFINSNCDQTSYSYLDHYSKSRPNFTGTICPGMLVPWTTFFARPKFLWQHNLTLNMELVKSAHMVIIFE